MMPAGFLRRSILTSTTGLHRGTSPTASRLVSTMNSQVYKTVKDLSGTPVGVGDSAGPAFTRRVILLRYLPVRRFRRVETTKLTGVNTTIRTRSEERRVGEEGRYRGGADHLKKKKERVRWEERSTYGKAVIARMTKVLHSRIVTFHSQPSCMT